MYDEGLQSGIAEDERGLETFLEGHAPRIYDESIARDGGHQEWKKEEKDQGNPSPIHCPIVRQQCAFEEVVLGEKPSNWNLPSQ